VHAAFAAVELVPGFVLQIGRGGGRTPYRIRALSLRNRRENHPFSGGYPVLLLIDDPDAECEQRSSDEALLSGIYSLTAAEARLAVRLASGASLTEVAETLGVTQNTVRSQLRAIFQKTATSRQSELVVLMGRSRSLR
jgi:DNA-binding CsgD family transcriptional regulator